MKIVLDIGDTEADAAAILAEMDRAGAELTGAGMHVGCRLVGVLREGCVFGPYDVVPLQLSARKL